MIVREMVPAAKLKAFEPLSAFDREERAYWERYASGGDHPPQRTVLLDRESGLEGAIATLVAEHEHGDLVERRGVVLVCPHRTRLRLLASVLAFRRSIPAEAVRAFMPEGEVERAAEEIESLRSAHPTWRSHILESAWEVPLHWFVAFDDAERRLEAGASGGAPALRYETSVESARDRCERALAIVRATLPNPAIIAPLAGIARWLEEFVPAGLLVLDYDALAGMIPLHALGEDRTCRDIWAAVRALSEGDAERATAFYMVAAERWSALRRRETLN